jgi:DNA polymerase-3 subunit delta'
LTFHRSTKDTVSPAAQPQLIFADIIQSYLIMPFAQILGQEKAVALLTRALTGARFAHGYLFLGPDGVGKAMTARELAAVLFCEAEQLEVKPCRRCRGCSLYFAGNHPDFIHLLPDGASIKIKQIRHLQEQVGFAPLEAKQRVILIEEAQLMGREAANSLLKLLEEPRPGNVLLLVAADSEPLLPTIVSRCQVIPFVTLSQELTAEIIQREEPEKSREETLHLAVLTEGSPGRSLALDAEHTLSLYQEAVRVLLAADRAEEKVVEDGLALAAQAAESKEDLVLLLDLLAVFFKEIMVGHLTNNSSSGKGLPEEVLVMARERWNLDELSDKLAAVSVADRALRRNCNRALVCETLFLRLLQ